MAVQSEAPSAGGAKRRRFFGRDKASPVNTLTPPEGVPIHFEVAGIGARFAAQLADLAITFALLVAAVLALRSVTGGAPVFALWVMLFFAIRVPYYVAAELLWNGRTLGKRMLGLQVVSADGRGLTAHAVVARNLMKEFEVFVPGTYLLFIGSFGGWEQALIVLWVGVLIVLPLFNRRHQRLGDMIAGTYVIRRPKLILLPDIAAAPASARAGSGEAYEFQPHQLEHYGRYELQVLEQVLQTGGQGDTGAGVEAQYRRQTSLAAIAEKVRAKIGYTDRVRHRDSEAFLRASYAQQRAFLEQRRLFGDDRSDKFHRSYARSDKR